MNEWRVVTDTDPPQGVAVLAFWMPQDGREVHPGCYAVATRSARGWREYGADAVTDPTHWTTLPAPPAS